MKKSIIFAALCIVGVSCSKNITQLNTDPKNPSLVSSASLFTNAQNTFASTLASSNVNLNIFRLVEQYWQETTYTDESRYDIVTRQIPDDIWTTFYRDVLKDLDQAKTLVPTEGASANVQKNQTAFIDIMQVYSYYYLVTTFGDIPYTDALNIGNTFPKYDKQKDVYLDLLKRIDADIAALNSSADAYGSADAIYNGDVAKWKKFANSLKLKMGITIADSDPATAKTAIESAYTAGVFTSNNDNALFQFIASPPNTNPVWVDLVQSGRKDFVANSTIIGKLDTLNDPRNPYYFTQDANGGYSGGAPGRSSNFATFSKPGGLVGDAADLGNLTSPDYPGDLLDFSEVEFYLSEAAARGYSVGSDAATHYSRAVTASIVFWGASTADAAAYLAQPSVNYLTAAGDFHQKIGTQAWLAFYNRGWDGWIENRRLDYPKLPAASGAKSGFPVRFTYPINEQNVNSVNYAAAASSVGGDIVTKKLFWDVF